MGKFVEIVRNKCRLFFNENDRIMGRIPTNTNLIKSGSDNHLYFGILNSDKLVELYINSITGNKCSNFAKIKPYVMTLNGTIENVIPNINAQLHIQLSIEENNKKDGVLRDIFDRNKINYINHDYGIFFDFNNNVVFIGRIDNKKITDVNNANNSWQIDYIINEKTATTNAKKELDKYRNNAEKEYPNDINKQNAYIESMVSMRSTYFQKIYRKRLLSEFDCKCAICNINVPQLLIASHIVAYTDCNNNEERIDNNNGLLLCSMHDDLFDKGFISFDKNGVIMLPNDIPSSMFGLLNISKATKLDNKFLTVKRIAYLKRHKKTH